MFRLPDTLPPGALIAAHPEATPMPDAIWWHGAQSSWQEDPSTGSLALWRAHGKGPPLEPTAPNKDNGLPGNVADLAGLQLRDGLHCGMVAQDIGATNAFTFAIRYYVAPGDHGRTLLTMNTAENYLFLSDSAGTLTAKDDANRVNATLPSPQVDAPKLAVVTLNGSDLTLATDSTTIHAKSTEPVLAGTGSLFVGCRNNRPRLLKTLGSALILDVWFFAKPIKDFTALQRHHLWASS